MQSDSGIKTELKFPLILIHTPFGLNFFDRIAKTKLGRLYAEFSTYLMPLITALAIFILVFAIIAIFSSDSVREGARDLGPQSNLLIPGLNPLLPITYTLIALFITIVVHEAGHGIVARVYNTKVDSTGIVLLLGIPIGAFVNIPQEDLDKLSFKQKSAILTAGPLNNMILAAISFGMLYLVISSLTPLPISSPPEIGIQVSGINEKSLAQSIGLTKDSIIRSINGDSVNNLLEFRKILNNNLGSSITIEWTSADKMEHVSNVKLPDTAPPNNAILGVTLNSSASDPIILLDIYKKAFLSYPYVILTPPTLQQGQVPFSDTMAPHYTSSIFGNSFPIIANFLYWTMFINFNVGIFNALPIAMLDGGQWYGTLLEKRIKSKNSKLNPSTILTLVMVAMVLMTIIVPWILR